MLLTPNIAGDAQRERRPCRAGNATVRRQRDGDRGRNGGEEGNLMRDASEPRPRPAVALAIGGRLFAVTARQVIHPPGRSFGADLWLRSAGCSSNPRRCGRTSGADRYGATIHDSTGFSGLRIAELDVERRRAGEEQ